MQTIGFTNTFYTLWEVAEPVTEPVYHGDLQVGSITRQSVMYLQNLSTDLEKAKAKLTGEYRIDLELRGHSSFSRVLDSTIKNREDYYPHDCFSFGRMEGMPFAECTDLWQLDRAWRQEQSEVRKENARKRLEVLGEVVMFNGEWIRTADLEAKQQQAYIDSLTKGHHFTHGEKVSLEIKRISHFHFDGQFGTTFVEIYATKCGKLVSYMGGNPLSIYDEFVRVIATIKHATSYNSISAENENVTRLLRIKIIK